RHLPLLPEPRRAAGAPPPRRPRAPRRPPAGRIRRAGARADHRDGPRLLSLRGRAAAVLRIDVRHRLRPAEPPRGAAGDGDADAPLRGRPHGDRARRAPPRRRPDGRHQRPLGADPRRHRARRLGAPPRDGGRPPRGGARRRPRERASRSPPMNAPKVNGVNPPAVHAATDWPFPFPPPGRPQPAAPHAVPPPLARRWPLPDLEPAGVPSRGVPAPVGLDEFKARCREWCDDVGVISIDDPAIAHERDEILYVYPHARSLVCMIGEENKAAMQSRYLPTANHELYSCEARIFQMGHRTVKLLNALGGEGLTTTIGWPQEVSQRWADKIWPLS